ncbi:MAG: NAD-dependent epimerase/dehydratase family protein, partial [Nitrososphaerota archaeon]
MVVLITGAAGFFGSWIIRELLDMGEKVVLLDIKRDYSRIDWVVPEARSLPFIEGDITAEGVI